MFGTIDKQPAFERYVGRLAARPAFARARELDDALMPKPQAANRA
jgi:glutathione S-transferase